MLFFQNGTEFKLLGKQCYKVFDMIYSFNSVQSIPRSNSRHSFSLPIYLCYGKTALGVVKICVPQGND